MNLILFTNLLFLFALLRMIASQLNSNEHVPQISHSEKQILPNFIEKYGKIGVNFNIDANNKPYIWCEKYEKATCQRSNPRECTTRVRCYADLSRSHRLGCMAVLIYNTSSAEPVTFNNSTNGYTVRAPDLKGCWSQGESELRECVSDDECVVDTRRTGAKRRAAKFCCCRAHDCNKEFIYRPSSVPQNTTNTQDEKIEDTDDDDPIWVQVFYGGLIVFLFIAICVACVILFLTLRKQMELKKRFLPESKNHLLPQSEWHNVDQKNEEHSVLIKEQKVNLNDAVVVQKIGNGRFAQVFEGRINDISVAIKIFQQSDVESWLKEQEIYSIKAINAHENIARFLGAIQKDDKFWLITLYYQYGSLYDYLKLNKPELFTGVKMIWTMLNGLAFLHDRTIGDAKKPTIVHRDFKSKNILIKEDLSVCIADFGLAMKCEGEFMSADASHNQVGTRRYMSPEVLEGATEFSNFAFQQIDVYAAALVIWEVVSRMVVPGIQEKEEIPEFMLPYEREVGSAPSLAQIRELVVNKKFRPVINPYLNKNLNTGIIVKTMEEMWDSEPDGRITSGCAKDRLLPLYTLFLNHERADNLPQPLPAILTNHALI